MDMAHADSASAPQAHTPADRRRALEHIRLLCHCGAGLAAVAGPLCHAVRDWIGAASGSIFWLDASGAPAGFFHDCAPAELKDFYVQHYDELFGGPNQITLLTFVHADGPPIGKALAGEFFDRWLRGNIHRHLCVPLGHHFILDMRLDVDGRGRAAFFAWNPPDRPFTAADATRLIPIRALMQTALAADDAGVQWQGVGDGLGHFITDGEGRTLIAIHPDAEIFLKESHLLNQNVAMTGAVAEAPSFASSLAAQLALAPTATLHLPIANGRLVARASPTRVVRGYGGGGALMHVALTREVARNALAVEYLMTRPLTPLQREIALYAMTGGRRGDSEAEFGVSDEALKKHLRAIFAVTAANRWIDLIDLPVGVS